MFILVLMFLSLTNPVSSANSTTEILSMDEHIEKLKSFTDDITEYINSPFPGLTISINPSNSTFKVVLVSGIHAGYLGTQDFLYNSINSIKSSLNESSFKSKCSFCKFYFFPVFNEPAHNALYEAYNSTEVISVFRTDSSNVKSCNESKDAGVNPNHNFENNYQDDSYSDSCNSNYSGTEMIGMVSSFVKFIKDNSPNVLIHLHRDKNIYVKAFTNSTEKDAGLVALVNEKLSEILPDGITLKNNFEAFGQLEFGTLVDFCAARGQLVVQIGTQDNFDDHLEFIYQVIDLALPKFEVKVKVEIETMKNSTMKNNKTSDDIEKLIFVDIEIQVLSAVSFEKATLILQFDHFLDETENIHCTSQVQSDYRNDAEEDCLDYFHLLKLSMIPADLPAFGKFLLKAEVLGKVKGKDEDDCSFTLSAEGLFEPVKVDCEFIDEDESEDSSESNPSNIIKLTTKATYIISASMVLIFLNVLLILVGLCWSFKYNRR